MEGAIAQDRFRGWYGRLHCRLCPHREVNNTGVVTAANDRQSLCGIGLLVSLIVNAGYSNLGPTIFPNARASHIRYRGLPRTE